MTIEQQVVSLELAKQLKEAGYPQESLFWWDWEGRKKPYLVIDSTQSYVNVCISAPTVAELGEKLKDRDNTNVFVWRPPEYDQVRKMWLYLKKEGLV